MAKAFSEHEKWPPEGSVCPTPRCGESRGQGHPPVGWIRLYVAMPDGIAKRAQWYCSALCVVNDLAPEAARQIAEQPLPLPSLTDALRYLGLCRLNATPRRVQQIAEHLEAGIETLAESGLAVREQQRLDAAYAVAMPWAREQAERDARGGVDEPEPDLLEALGA